jgi:hypothetical protein
MPHVDLESLEIRQLISAAARSAARRSAALLGNLRATREREKRNQKNRSPEFFQHCQFSSASCLSNMYVHMPHVLVQQLRCHRLRDLIIDKTGDFELWQSKGCGKLKHREAYGAHCLHVYHW